VRRRQTVRQLRPRCCFICGDDGACEHKEVTLLPTSQKPAAIARLVEKFTGFEQVEPEPTVLFFKPNRRRKPPAVEKASAKAVDGCGKNSRRA